MHASHSIVREITRGVLETPVWTTSLSVVRIERANLSADYNHFIGNHNARICLTLPLLHELSLVSTIVPGTYLGEDSLLDEFFPFQAFQGFRCAFIK